MAVLKLKITTARDTNTLKSIFETAGGNHAICQRIVNFIESINGGSELAQGASTPPSIAISIQNNQVLASQTVTFSAVATANDTVVINGVTFTAAAAAGANQWAVGASATASAAGLAAAINASVTALISGYVTATSALGVTTVTSAFYGLAGNTATIAEGVDAGNVMTVGGARLTGGLEDATAQTLNF